MNQPQPEPEPVPQPTELAAALLKRVREVELPAYLSAALIVLSVRENWTPAHFRSERFKAKWRYFFDQLLREVEAEEAPEEEGLPMLREGEDGEC